MKHNTRHFPKTFPLIICKFNNFSTKRCFLIRTSTLATGKTSIQTRNYKSISTSISISSNTDQVDLVSFFSCSTPLFWIFGWSLRVLLGQRKCFLIQQLSLEMRNSSEELSGRAVIAATSQQHHPEPFHHKGRK